MRCKEALFKFRSALRLRVASRVAKYTLEGCTGFFGKLNFPQNVERFMSYVNGIHHRRLCMAKNVQ